MRVLVADDDDVVLSVLESLLADLGHEAVLARDGVEAWELMQRRDAPSLVILDWLMPGLPGIQLCRQLRESGKRPYQYVIMLTAKDKMADLVEGMDAGADDYLRKPFDARELRARLHVGERMLALQDELRAQATFDALTGLLNRGALLERLTREGGHATRKCEPISIVLMDLDNFKHVNDAHGHPVGDEVLREASARLAARMRPYDELGRFGGEEFLAVLPHCDLTCASGVAERMRASLAASPVSTSAGPLPVSASFGVATLEAGARFSAAALISNADKALYHAKRGGRNRVEAHSPPG
jgi:two-component system cell cycle response regulator